MAEGKAKRMWALPGAVFVVPQSSLMVGGSNEIIEVPVPSFLIEHPKGLVLYDTGSHPKVAEDVASYWGEMFRNMVRFSKDLTVDNQIKALGYKVTDVKYVVMCAPSHGPHRRLVHVSTCQAADHEGRTELRLLAGSVSAQESSLNDDFLPTRNYETLAELEGEFDMFGDGALTMLHTPGHTPGSTSLVVRLPHQNIVLAGDAVHMRDALDTEHTMLVDTNPAQSVRWNPTPQGDARHAGHAHLGQSRPQRLGRDGPRPEGDRLTATDFALSARGRDRRAGPKPRDFAYFYVRDICGASTAARRAVENDLAAAISADAFFWSLAIQVCYVPNG